VTIHSSKEDGVQRIVFDRPEKKNAITSAMYQLLADSLSDANEDPLIRVIVISGLPTIFTAGNDLDDFIQHPPSDSGSPVFQFMQRMQEAEKPIVAMVAGAAVGIGTTMLLHCDLVYVAENARFSVPFSQLGLCPEFGSSLLLQRGAGSHRAAEKLLFGETFDAEEACKMGFVNRILPNDTLRGFVEAQVQKLVALPSASLLQTKKLMKDPYRVEVALQIRRENDVFRSLLSAPAAVEAMTAFSHKRKPDFSKLL
jgi:enoyl-CoA hydratase/carnithine racemase